MTNRGPLESTGNSTQYSVMTYMGTESKKRIGICMTDSLCRTAETNNIVNHLYSNKNFKKGKKADSMQLFASWLSVTLC